jgi:hypothetical protein
VEVNPMRKEALLVIVVAVTLGFHPATEVAADMAVVAATLETLTGQVVAVFPEARQLTIKKAGWFRVKEVSFVVAEEAAPSLAELQIGDRVEVGYVETQGHPLARRINKMPVGLRGWG